MPNTKYYYFKYHYPICIHIRYNYKDSIHNLDFVIYGLQYNDCPTKKDIENYISFECNVHKLGPRYPHQIHQNSYGWKCLKNPKWKKVQSQCLDREYQYLCKFIINQLDIQDNVYIHFFTYDPLNVINPVLFVNAIFECDNVYNNLPKFCPLRYHTQKRDAYENEYKYLISFDITPYLHVYDKLPQCINLLPHCTLYDNYVTELTLNSIQLSQYKQHTFSNLQTLKLSIDSFDICEKSSTTLPEKYKYLSNINSLVLYTFEHKYNSRYIDIVYLIPHLTQLKIELNPSFFHLPNDSIQLFNYLTNDLIQLFNYLQNHKTLIDFSFSFHITLQNKINNKQYQSFVNAIYDLIKYNTKLEKLCLTQNIRDPNKSKIVHYNENLLIALQQNTTLTDVRLYEKSNCKSYVYIENISLVNNLINNCHSLQKFECDLLLSLDNIRKIPDQIMNVITEHYYKPIIKSFTQFFVTYNTLDDPIVTIYVSNHKKYNKLLSKLAQ